MALTEAGVYEFPVPNDAPPLIEEYQLIVPPVDDASIVAVVAPQVVACVTVPNPGAPALKAQFELDPDNRKLNAVAFLFADV